MDPISITTGVLALVGNAIKLFDLVHTYSSAFQRTELNIELLSTECKTLQLALVHIDNFCTSKDAAIDSSVRLVLADCEEKFKILLEKLQPFVEPVGSSRPSGMNIRDRISATLKAKDIDFYRQCIQGEVQLVNMLLKTLEHQPPMKNRETVEGSQKLQELLKKSQHDTKSLRTMNERDKSLFYAGASSTKDLGSTTGADMESVTIGDEEFQFDDELINTPAYRRAFKSRQRIISGPCQAGSATSSTPPTLQSSAKGSSNTGLSKFIRKAMKIEHSGGSSSSVAKTAVADSIIVEPSDEIMARDDVVLTEVDVRDTKAKFYELMALHGEILAMKFADKSYNNILQEKIQRRGDILLHLQVTVMNWRLRPDIIQPGLTGDEFESLERTGYSLASLGTNILSGR